LASIDRHGTTVAGKGHGAEAVVVSDGVNPPPSSDECNALTLPVTEVGNAYSRATLLGMNDCDTARRPKHSRGCAAGRESSPSTDSTTGAARREFECAAAPRKSASRHGSAPNWFETRPQTEQRYHQLDQAWRARSRRLPVRGPSRTPVQPESSACCTLRRDARAARDRHFAGSTALSVARLEVDADFKALVTRNIAERLHDGSGGACGWSDSLYDG